MVHLTDSEIRWLGETYPELSYDTTTGFIRGPLYFKLKYNEVVIADHFEILIDLASIDTRAGLPKVFNTDNRIKNSARRKNKSTADFHINGDGSLCLIFERKIDAFYPNGFELDRFIEHLSNHLYWISYYERFEREPWHGEEHGEKASVEMCIDMAFEQDNIDAIRIIHKSVLKRGIAKSKLKRLLRDKSLTQKLIKQIKNECFNNNIV